MADLPSGAVTFLFTDVESSTQLVKQLRDRYSEVLAQHQRLLREAFERHGGYEIDTQGDAFFVAFANARDAVLAAIEGQRKLAQHEWPDGTRLKVRIGIHTGQARPVDGRYTGVAVHRAARISAAGHGGQILISQTTHNLLEDEEDEISGVRLRDLGEHQLKDLDRLVRVYQVEAGSLAAEFPPLRTAAPSPAAEPVHPHYRRRTILVGALAGVIAAAVAIPIFALGRGGSPGGLGDVGGSAVGVIQPGSGQVEVAIETPAAPTAVASGLGYVWATSADANAVYAIDPETDTVQDTIPVDNAPAGVAVGAGSVWVANSLAGTVSQIDPGFGPVQSIAVGNGPTGIAIDGAFVWVANTTDHTVSKIRASTGKRLHDYPAGTDPSGIAVGGGAVWVASKSTGLVLKLSLDGEVRRVIPVGEGPAAAAVGAGGVWVANSLAETVSRIDPRTGDVVDTIQVGGAPIGIAVSRGSVWVANEADGTVARIDPSSNEPTTVRLRGRPTAIAAGEGGVYVALRPGGTEHRGGTLRVATGQVDFTIDPAAAFSNELWRLISLTNDGLLTFRRVGGQPGYEIVPDLAASKPVASEDGRTYTFELRSGIRYSTGREVKASDLRESLERVFTLRPHPPEEIGQLYGAIEGAERCGRRRCDLSRGIVTDDPARTVTFHLSEPDPIFLYKLALTFASVLPANTSSRQALRRPVPATGPYRIASVDPGRSIRLVRNPRFREWSSAAQPAGLPDEIVMEVVGSQQRRVSLVAQTKSDLTTQDLLHPFRLGPALRPQLRRYPLPVTFYFFMNPTKPPFDDERARRALNYAVDRNKLLHLAGDAEDPATTCQVLPPNFPGYRRHCPYTLNPTSAGTWTAPDLPKAQRLVAASGTKGDLVTIFYPRSEVPRVGRYITSLVESLGYQARVRAFKNQEEYFGAVTTSSPNLAWSGWLPNYPTAADFIAPLFSCGSDVNFGHFCDRRLHRKIDRALKLQQRDPAAAIRLWAELDRGLTDTAAWLPLYNRYGADLVSKRVGNYQYNPQFGALLSQMWVR